jgi:hypothetical protein
MAEDAGDIGSEFFIKVVLALHAGIDDRAYRHLLALVEQVDAAAKLDRAVDRGAVDLGKDIIGDAI